MNGLPDIFLVSGQPFKRDGEAQATNTQERGVGEVHSLSSHRRLCGHRGRRSRGCCLRFEVQQREPVFDSDGGNRLGCRRYRLLLSCNCLPFRRRMGRLSRYQEGQRVQ